MLEFYIVLGIATVIFGVLYHFSRNRRIGKHLHIDMNFESKEIVFRWNVLDRLILFVYTVVLLLIVGGWEHKDYTNQTRLLWIVAGLIVVSFLYFIISIDKRNHYVSMRNYRIYKHKMGTLRTVIRIHEIDSMAIVKNKLILTQLNGEHEPLRIVIHTSQFQILTLFLAFRKFLDESVWLNVFNQLVINYDYFESKVHLLNQAKREMLFTDYDEEGISYIVKSDVYKITSPVGIKVEYVNNYQIQILEDGSKRIAITTLDSLVDLQLEIVELFDSELAIMYVLTSPKEKNDEGRYISTEYLTYNQLNDFSNDYRSLLEYDSRHEFWVYAPNTNQTVILGRHGVIYAYGCIEKVESLLQSKGYNETTIEIEYPHLHRFYEHFDVIAKRIIIDNEWTKEPCVDGDFE